jgi:hypothetical protein
MKFSINEIVLYLKNNKTRSLKFERNKINVLRGKSGTGKTSIMAIIDYCLLSSRSRLVEEVINENVDWYCLNFNINNKNFLIARKSQPLQRVSDEVYFSSNGILPEILSANIIIDDLKKIIEAEFSINRDLIVPYGGKKIKPGSKISFRYFLLFNTQSDNIIKNPNVYFDYDLYDRDKYKEALDRIFELSIGLDTVQGMLIKDKIRQLDSDHVKLEKQSKVYDKEQNVFSQNILQLLKEAQEFQLIEGRLFDISEAKSRLRNLVDEFSDDASLDDISVIENLKKEKRNILRKLSNFESFKREYSLYHGSLQKNYDSLKPVEYLQSNKNELLQSPEIRSFMDGLAEELKNIKGYLNQKTPFNTNVDDKIKIAKEELSKVQSKIDSYPTAKKEFKDSVSKYIFIGELKAKLYFFEKGNLAQKDFQKEISDIEKEIQTLEKLLAEDLEKKKVIFELLEGNIQKYLNQATSLGNYVGYKAFFDNKNKLLKLRESKSIIPTIPGSSSNHLFMHLCFFLGLHEHMIIQKVNYIPQFLILDQPSQPYFEEAKKKGSDELIEKSDDWNKLTEAFTILNNFISHLNKEYSEEFQFIIFEHAPKKIWEEADLDNFYLVDEFEDGNALIPIE